MSNPNHVKTFLGRLESSVNDKHDSLKALQRREEQYLFLYMKNKTWPGKDYMYIGHSQNLEHSLLGTEIHFQRKTCLALLFKAKGDENHCVSLAQALNFEGFNDMLCRFEKQILKEMPPQTMLGPAYNDSGEILPTAFTIWRALMTEDNSSRVLINA